MGISASCLHRYKGPAILVLLSASLIVAFAIPRTNFGPTDPELIELDAHWTATVKRNEVQVGDVVEPGQPLMVLVDPDLESKISQVEAELKQAMLGSKEAVVETEMLGMIGSLPRVTYELPSNKSVNPGAQTHSTRSETIQIKPLETAVEQLAAQIDRIQIEVEAKSAQSSETAVNLDLADTDLRLAAENLDLATKNRDKMLRLYDIGAIPKKRLDAAESDLVLSLANKENATVKVAEVIALQNEIAAEIVTLRDKQTKAIADLAAAKQKLSTASIQAKKVFLEIPSVTPSRLVRKVVYGTSMSQNTAPLEVKLVDSIDPTQDQRVNEIRNRLMLLRSKRDALKVLAPVRGEVVEITAVGTQVARLDNLVKVKSIR